MKRRLPAITQQVIHNWLYKMVALCVALAIWITTIHGRKDTILVRNVDLVFETSRSMVVAGDIERSVRVKVIGPRAALKKFVQMPATISIKLTDDKPGMKKVVLSPSDVVLPAGVKLKSINPTELNVELQEVSGHDK